MPTVTIPRDVTSKDIANVLTARLGRDYQVQLGKRVNWGFGRPEDADFNSIAVTAGSGRFIRTLVSIDRNGSSSTVRIETPGPVQLRILNAAAGITKRVHQALLDSTELEAR